MARRGFTLLEFVLVICIIGLLVAMAVDRLLALRVEAERVAMNELLGSMRAGVAMELVSLLARGRDRELARLEDSNPIDALMQEPSTYVGEFDAPDPARMPSGRWYFDRGAGLLVYRVRHEDYFETALPGPPRARFRVRLVYEDRNGNGTFDAGIDGIGGVRITASEPYRWLDERRQAARRANNVMKQRRRMRELGKQFATQRRELASGFSHEKWSVRSASLGAVALTFRE